MERRGSEMQTTSVGSIQQLWKSIVISELCRGKFSESRMILIVHSCNLWRKRWFLSLVLLFGSTDFTCWCGACLRSFAHTPMKCFCLRLLSILHPLLSESWTTLQFPNVQSPVHPHFQSISCFRGWAFFTLEGEIAHITSFCPCFAFLDYRILYTCQVRTQKLYRKGQLSDCSVKAEMNNSVLLCLLC